MKIENAFGEILRELRTEKGLSQEKLALDTDLDRTFISLLERGLRQPSLKTIFLIAKRLNIKPNKLIERVENITNK